MTFAQRKANINANRVILKQWWREQPIVRHNGHPLLLIFHVSTAYFAEHYVRYGGHTRLEWRRMCSVDLRQPSIFNERGKLRVRLLRERFAK